MPTSASVFTKLTSGYMSVSKSSGTWDGILPQGPFLAPIRSPFANQISFSVTWVSYDFHIRICRVRNWSHDKGLPRPLHSGPAAVVSTRWKWQFHLLYYLGQHLKAHACSLPCCGLFQQLLRSDLMFSLQFLQYLNFKSKDSFLLQPFF